MALTGRQLLEYLQLCSDSELDMPVHAAMDAYAYNEMSTVVANETGVWLE